MKTKNIFLITMTTLLALSLAACKVINSTAQDPLEGTSWVLSAFSESKPIPGTTLTASFQDGQVSGSAGCNSYSGTYQVEGEVIQIGPVAITEMACLEPEGVMDQELKFVQFLQDGETFQLEEGQLYIFRADGEALTFAQQQ